MRALLICLVDGFFGVVSFESPEDMDAMISSHAGHSNWTLIFDDGDVAARIMRGDGVLGSVKLLGGRFRFPSMSQSEDASCSFQVNGQI